MRTRTLVRWGLGFAFFGMASGALAADIPLVGLDDEGRPVEVMISDHDYTQQMQAVVTTVNDSVLPVLEERGDGTRWTLKTVVVGLGVGFEVGLGPIIKLKATPRFRLAFARDADVVMP